jgi:hypothetical protein
MPESTSSVADSRSKAYDYDYHIVTGKKDSTRWKSAVQKAHIWMNTSMECVVDVKCHVTTTSKVVIIILFQKNAPSDGVYGLAFNSNREKFENTVHRVRPALGGWHSLAGRRGACAAGVARAG